MTKRSLFSVYLLVAALSLFPNLLSDLLSPLFDPGDSNPKRALMIVLLFLLFSIAVVVSEYRNRQPSADPDDPDIAGWTETAAAVLTVATAALILCWQFSSDQAPLYIWLVPILEALSTFYITWPSQRQKQYREMEAWILRQLLEYGRVSVEAILAQFASTPAAINQRIALSSTPLGYYYTVLIRWFLHHNAYRGIVFHEGVLSYSPSSEPR